MGGVFINYRGDDSRAMGELLDRDLAATFGREQVFLDCYSIRPGADFAQELMTQVRSCRVLLVVIDRDWLTITTPAGGRRIDDPADWIHREIVEAFTAGVRVVPVLVDDTDPPTEKQLPADLQALARCQAVTVRRRHTRLDVSALIHQLCDVEPTLALAAASAPSTQDTTITDAPGPRGVNVTGGVHGTGAGITIGAATGDHVTIGTPPPSAQQPHHPR
ncbi:toll/interleukin-1 receptor domain-containing protein [Amycolatopsis sp. OK19-0408]|uniref:Toll/interleukin-1 receptor domain-containing protein n=1 Tax=Amycolatopsis iheyensis TaxID=2945988 RepID=A0A9X2NKC0_9PSEU|nr:toll/interleukin-1 receptor domain-containing protein [Amycolatopsis iheyensis]MCR6488375.1 toll/interleukin-1 receptor domain-containing protein [Amycolatopsis iheyensis]